MDHVVHAFLHIYIVYDICILFYTWYSAFACDVTLCAL